VWPKGFGKFRKFIHLIGLEPATFHLVAQCLNHYTTTMSLWGALSDERSGLSFVSQSVVICLQTHEMYILNVHT
jgi:hypothetical protein